MTEHTSMTLESLELLFSAQTKISRSSPLLHSRTLPQRSPSKVCIIISVHSFAASPLSQPSKSSLLVRCARSSIFTRASAQGGKLPRKSISTNTSYTRRQSQKTPLVTKMTETNDLTSRSFRASLLWDRRIPRMSNLLLPSSPPERVESVPLTLSDTQHRSHHTTLTHPLYVSAPADRPLADGFNFSKPSKRARRRYYFPRIPSIRPHQGRPPSKSQALEVRNFCE
ncbi:hypothetical protein GJ744_002447 [Endocarpon pusillum]|uniref:Uncharacterized protein n=1 Tax=Endocarpon pusillum TaxID=364733 RepID=A0A8H7DZZ6_9EURO|nr:hypothetical protein GJ744_002447 [Endocarpon pusillum]